MKKLRILLLNYEFPPLGGGGGVAAKKLAEGFIKNGYDVDYVTTWFKGLKECEVVDGIHVYRVKVPGRKEVQTATMFSLITFPIYARSKAIELCNKYNYAFMNTHFAIPTGPLGVAISKKYGIKNILSIHGGDIYDPTKKYSPHTKSWLKQVVKWVLNNSDIIVAQSSNTKENALTYYHPKKEIDIIPLAYESYKFKKASKKQLGLKKDIKYLVSCGRLVKRKGYEFLIQSLAQLNNEKVHALIIGEGPEKDDLKNLAKKLNIEKQVHFLGALSEEKKFQYYSNSDIYVLSSVHEGFGIVLQEAMQAGLPIIATNHGGQVDLITEGKNGFLINYGDTQALVQRIQKILAHPTLASALSTNNKNYLKAFNISNIAKKYSQLLQ